MKDQNGFTLIEVLVAFVILSIAVIFSFESYSNGLRILRQAKDALEAQVLSQSILARALIADSVFAESRGVAGQMTWRQTVRPIKQKIANARSAVIIEVHVFDRQDREVSAAALSTIIISNVAGP